MHNKLITKLFHRLFFVVEIYMHELIIVPNVLQYMRIGTNYGVKHIICNLCFLFVQELLQLCGVQM